MSNINPNCDGSHCINPDAPVKTLPLDAELRSNLIVCRVCFEHEIQWRRKRNKELPEDCRYPLPKWSSLEKYPVE